MLLVVLDLLVHKLRVFKDFIVDASPFAETEEGEEPNENLKALEGFKKVFINPIIEEETGKKWSFSEGCLSIPGIREDVDRMSIIKISYFDENWKFHEQSFTGIAARIIQHEYDHIEGGIFKDNLNPLKRRLLKRKLEDISKGKVEVDYKMKFPNLKNEEVILPGYCVMFGCNSNETVDVPVQSLDEQLTSLKSYKQQLIEVPSSEMNKLLSLKNTGPSN